MLRVALESVLGLTLDGGAALRIAPCVPDAWPGFRMHVRRRDARSRCATASGRAEAVVACTVDGAPGQIVDGAARIPLRNGGAPQRVLVELGPAR